MRVYAVKVDADWNEISEIVGIYETREEAEKVRAEAADHPRAYGTAVESYELGVTRDVGELLD